jgi:glycosyltransferase involved in cell wall biosynthesis
LIVTQFMTSPFYGGPERLVLGLTQSLPRSLRSAFVLFGDKGKSGAFRRQILEHGLEATTLTHDTPHLPAMVAELTRGLREFGTDVLCCHGYKADVVGLLAARRARVPVIAMSHGWTSETWKVRVYETIDRACLRRMDRVVCVSAAQAETVRRAGVRADRVVVIRNAVRAERFDGVDPGSREALLAMFPERPELVVGSAGRLSPEKGFGVLVEAAAIVVRSDPSVGFIHFGNGPLSKAIQRRIEELGLQWRFILAGFRDDLDRFLPHWDLSVLPSFREGLPTVVLESYAAAVPVVATAVGGTPEVVADGVDGYLVPPGDPTALARRILDVLKEDKQRHQMGRLGRERVRAEFSFDAQAMRFERVCEELLTRRRPAATIGDLARNFGEALR